MSPFEIGMLICFGISWPVSILKSLRTRTVEGKSPLFMAIVCLGYVCGIIHKIVYNSDWVVILYALNLLMVLADLSLYYRFRGCPAATRL
jgi:hypothetical protein